MTHPCPRMAEVGHGPGSNFNLPTDSKWRDDHTCSWCGGLNPKEVFRLLGKGARIITTNKKYKMYLEHPDLGSIGKIYFQHFNLKERNKFSVEFVKAKEGKRTSDTK